MNNERQNILYSSLHARGITYLDLVNVYVDVVVRDNPLLAMRYTKTTLNTDNVPDAGLWVAPYVESRYFLPALERLISKGARKFILKATYWQDVLLRNDRKSHAGALPPDDKTLELLKRELGIVCITQDINLSSVQEYLRRERLLIATKRWHVDGFIRENHYVFPLINRLIVYPSKLHHIEKNETAIIRHKSRHNWYR